MTKTEWMRERRKDDTYRERERLAAEVARLRSRLAEAYDVKWQFQEGFNAYNANRAFNARASAEWREGYWTARRVAERRAGHSVLHKRMPHLSERGRNGPGAPRSGD